MRNENSNRNKTTWPNTGTRLNPDEFYEPFLNRQIDINEMGRVEAFNDFAEHISQAVGLKREEGMWEAVTELESLMRGDHIGNNSMGNSKISGPLSVGIAKTLLYGKERKKIRS